MKKRVPDKFWFPWWPDKWIFGSVRIEFTPAERGMWVDMLSLASKDNGHIRANEETPYPLAQLAGMLIIPEKELNAAISKFIKHKKLSKLKSGTLYVTKWEKYQFSERHKRRVEDEMSDGKPEEIDVFSKNTIKCPSSFSDMATEKGFVKVSRLIAAIILERSLKPGEEVHHRNGEEKDNRVENLMLFANHADHGKYEYGYTIRPLWDGSKMQMSEKTAAIAKIKATIIDNITLNNNKLENNIELREQIIDFFNETTNQKRSYTCDGTNKLINGRLSEGKTIDDFKHVINTKYTQWRNDEKMSQFIRPSTLFRPENFENYLNEPYEDPKKKILKVGESTHIPSKKEDDYMKARAIKMKELQKKYQSETDKAMKAKSTDWMDEIDNKIKEEIAEFSREYHKKEEK